MPSAAPPVPAAAAWGTLCLAAQFAGVEFGDQVTQGAESMVVAVFRNLGAAAGGVGAVAVEFGFVVDVGAGAVEDTAMPISRRALTAAKGHPANVDERY